MSDSNPVSANGSNHSSKNDRFQISYPMFLIPHGGGYLSIVNPDNTAVQMLVVCSSRELAMQLVCQFELLSSLKELSNDREFVWLLRSVKKPVSQVVFDPRPIAEDVNAVEIVDIGELLENRLHPDLSPWNYPVYTIATDDGFISIESDDGSGELIRLICLFTNENLGNAYLQAAGQSGQFCPLRNVGEARTFLSSLDRSIAVAVAMDPVIDNENHSAKYCFSIEILLEKYLISESSS